MSCDGNEAKGAEGGEAGEQGWVVNSQSQGEACHRQLAVAWSCLTQLGRDL